RIDLFVPDGGPAGMGFVAGRKLVDPEEWFFKAHFHQDPVWPGSLGLEAFLQLLQAVAAERWGAGPGTRFRAMLPGQPHSWSYRGQVTPPDRSVTGQAAVTALDDDQRSLRADGLLSVDGRLIYQMNGFTLRMPPESR